MRISGRLTIKGRIVAFQLIVGLAVLAIAVFAFVAVRQFDFHLERGAAAHRQLEALTGLARKADQYSEKIAEVLALGAPAGADVARLHSDISLGLSRLDRLTRDEQELLEQRGEAIPGASLDETELALVVRLSRLYADWNLKIGSLLALRQSGQQAAAIGIFHREIESGVDDEFERLVAAAIGDETREIAAADGRAKQLARRLALTIAAITALVVLGTAAASWRLTRAVVGPIRRLSAGAVAIGGGDLAARIGPLGGDELGLLARRFDDMAERIEAQNRLLVAARSGLEGDVRERTAELLVANAALEDRDRSRLRFLADVSHELRTPLTVLRGEAEVTLRAGRADAAQYRETLRRVVEEAGEMTRLVEDLLVMARSETEDIRFACEPVDLRRIAAEAVRDMQPGSRARGLEMRTDLAAATVTGDPRRMKQILAIVLDNAVKYSDRKGVIDVGLRESDGDAVATVRNRSETDGEDELPRLFDRFYRGREAAASGAGGSGLGLAIARWMVEKQGGSIGIERQGAFIVVTIRFPLVATAALPEDRRRLASTTMP